MKRRVRGPIKQRARTSLVAVLRSCIEATGERGRRLFAEASAQGQEALLEVFEPVETPRGKVVYYCLGDLALWRVRTLFSKEPETIEWIDSFENGDVFWDIGANMGLYSVYASVGRRIEVVAFEPSASNYLLLNRNIEHNGLSDKVRAYCVALAARTTIDFLNMQSTSFADANSSFAESRDYKDRPVVPSFRQAMIGYTVDEFIERFNPPFPTHIKIDVDGLEGDIIKGAEKTLRDERLKSISIEMEAGRTEYVADLLGHFRGAGFELVSKRRSDIFDGSPYENVYNYLLRRNR
jgi:FkbM family methyltransferase